MHGHLYFNHAAPMSGEPSTLPHPLFYNTFQGGLYLVALWKEAIWFPHWLKPLFFPKTCFSQITHLLYNSFIFLFEQIPLQKIVHRYPDVQNLRWIVGLIHCAKSASNMVVWYIWFLLISPPVNHSDSILNSSMGFKSD